jgi:hypothetical protein
VPVNGFYLLSDGRLHCFLPYSSDLGAMIDTHKLIHDIEEMHPNLFRNFTPSPEGYLYHANEVAFAFLFTLYKKAKSRIGAHQAADELGPDFDDFFPLKPYLSGAAQLEFFRLHGESMGQTVRLRRIAKFHDAEKLFRLFKHFESAQISMDGLFRVLLDLDAKKEAVSLLRDRFLGRVLERKSVLDLAESHAFHVNRHNRPVNIESLAEFLLVYEPLARKERSMTEKEREAAVSIGKRIGSVVAKKDGRKGDLFSLRKARTVADFLRELNRLQFRYPIAVPPDVYEGALRHDSFEEFRGFCMVAALNTFNAIVSSKVKEEQQ